jgi:hypothetical protein
VLCKCANYILLVFKGLLHVCSVQGAPCTPDVVFGVNFIILLCHLFEVFLVLTCERNAIKLSYFRNNCRVVSSA